METKKGAPQLNPHGLTKWDASVEHGWIKPPTAKMPSLHPTNWLAVFYPSRLLNKAFFDIRLPFRQLHVYSFSLGLSLSGHDEVIWMNISRRPYCKQVQRPFRELELLRRVVSTRQQGLPRVYCKLGWFSSVAKFCCLVSTRVWQISSS